MQYLAAVQAAAVAAIIYSLSEPTGVTATAGDTQVTISWNAVNGATSYNIYYAAGSGGTTTYTVGGTVSGLSGTLVLQNNSGDDLTITTNGAFTFTTSLADGAAYNVTVKTQPVGQTCTIWFL